MKSELYIIATAVSNFLNPQLLYSMIYIRTIAFFDRFSIYLALNIRRSSYKNSKLWTGIKSRHETDCDLIINNSFGLSEVT